MALASLTVDLTLGLAKFEADSGRAAQVIARDTEKMSAGARAFERQLARMADQAGRTQTQFLALRAAELGIGENSKAAKLIEQIERQGTATAAATAAQVSAISEITTAAEKSAERQRALNLELIQSIRAVNAAYQQRREQLIAQEKAGQITPQQLKTGLSGLSGQREDSINQLKAAATAERQAILQAEALAKADREAADAAVALAAKQRAAAQVVVDGQNGITASYRQRLAALRELRDAGQLTPAQFKAAGSELVNQQPAVQARRREVEAAQAAAAAQERAAQEVAVVEANVATKRAAAAQIVIDKQNGLSAAYRAQLAALRELRDAGNITPAQFRAAGSELASQQPGVQARRKEVEAAQAAAQATVEAHKKAAQEVADNEAALAQKRAAAAQVVIDRQNGLSAAYRQQLTILRELRDAGNLSPVQFKAAGADLVAQQPGVVARRKEAEAIQAAADAAQRAAAEVAEADLAAAAKRQTAAQALIDRQNGLTSSYRQQLAALRELRDQGDITPAQFKRASTELVGQQPALAARRAETEAARKAAEEVANGERKKADAAATATASFVQSLERQADAIGKTRTQLLLDEAARRGVTEQVKPFIDRIDAAEKNLNKFGRTSGLAKYQMLTLQYTISDVAASLASGISPFTILLQQGGQVADVFAGNGGVGAIFKGLASFITPLRVAFAGAAGGAAAFFYALYQGAQQTREINDAIVLTGNFAGTTEGQVRSLARQIAASGEVQVRTAREAAVALAQTGQVDPKNFAAATEAAARFSDATGKSTKEVAQQFAELNRDVTGGAAKLNQTYNFLTFAQFQQIRTLQESGREAEAAAIVYEALNTRLGKLEGNLGTLDRALRATKNGWATFWDAAFDVGRPETIDDKIATIEKRIGEAQRKITPGGLAVAAVSILQAKPEVAFNTLRGAADSGQVGDLQTERNGLLRLKATQEAAAAVAAETAKLNKEGIEADGWEQGFLRRAKATEGLTKALDEAQRKFDVLARLGRPVAPATQASILNRIREDYTDKSANSEAQQVRRQELDQALKFLQQRLQDEKDTISQSNAEEQALYNAGLSALTAFYAKRNAVIDQSVQDELDALTDRQAVLELYRDDPKTDPSERVRAQTLINEAIEEGARITTRAAAARKTSDIEQGQALKQLTDRVVEYRAQLLQLEGDEAGAARLRAQQTIETARILSKQSGGSVSEDDLRRQQRALDLTNQFAEVQRRVSLVTADAASAEELYLLLADRSGKSLVENEQAVYQIRQKALDQLGTLAEQARLVAAATTDPKLKQAAADLALQFAKAVDAVNPAIVRLREAVRGLADEISGTLASAVLNIGSATRDRFQQEAAGTDSQRKLYDDQLKELRGYLKSSSDEREKALLRDQIRQVESRKKGLEVDKVDVALKTVEQQILRPILKQIEQTAIKVLVQDPLKKTLENTLRGLTEGDGGFAKFLSGLLGGKDGASGAAGAAAETAKQAAALTASQTLVAANAEQATSAYLAGASLDYLMSAATEAAIALSEIQGDGASGLAGLFGSGSASFGTGVGDFVSGGGMGFALADGTNYVPYDGFQATLHKGESVTPAKYNPSAGGQLQGSQRPLHVVVNNHAGADVQTNQNSAGDLEVIVKAAKHEVIRDMRNGGSVHEALKSTYGLRRNLPRRD